MEEINGIVKYDAGQNSPASMMMTAIREKLDLAQVEKAMLLQKRWEANEARKAYHLAMSKFKADPPEIEKDRKVSFKAGSGTTAYNHASLANVTSKINAALSVQSLSAAWETVQGEGGKVTVTCRITHAKGHSESTSLTAMPDTSGSKNAIQAIGSTISYLERYTLLALTGLATHDMDDDGKGSEPEEFINEKQVSQILDMINDKNADEAKFCEYFKIESVDKMPASRFNEAVKLLKAKKKVEKATPVKKAEEDLKALIDKKNKELGVDEPGSQG